MVSRGIDGVIIDWYGPDNSIDQATQLVTTQAENHPGFTFAIMIDRERSSGTRALVVRRNNPWRANCNTSSPPTSLLRLT
jgi:hypothetical protein